MTKAARIEELKKLRAFMQTMEFREMAARIDTVAKVAALLSYDPSHSHQASYFGQILSRPGFSSGMYESARGSLERLTTQAITELEIDSEETPAPHVSTAANLTSATDMTANTDKPPILSSEHSFLWFWHHCDYRVKWSLLGLAASAAATIFCAGFALGGSELGRDIRNLISNASKQSATNQPIDTKTLPTRTPTTIEVKK